MRLLEATLARTLTWLSAISNVTEGRSGATDRPRIVWRGLLAQAAVAQASPTF
jgi:hypothetical protein